jgi:hypothetical protein
MVAPAIAVAAAGGGQPVTIGWYIHHHGAGHLHRFLAVRPGLPGVVALSSLSRPSTIPDRAWVQLPLDAPASRGSEPEAGGALHWAPLRHDGLRRRMAQIAAWIARARPDALVVDVSVEVALLGRLLGVPVVWIAQRGRRIDDPHRTAFQAASAILAPWTQATQHDEICAAPARTVFVGAVSRFDDRTPEPPPRRRRVLLLVGRGGHELDAHELRRAIRRTHQWQWSTLGLRDPAHAASASGLDIDRVWQHLLACDVVVAGAGSNVIAETAAARRPMICLPQTRPFDEQVCAARSLAASGLVECCEHWPPTHRWDALLDRALARDPSRWEIFHDGAAADRIRDQIERVACA